MEDQMCFICWGGSAEGILEKPCKCRIAHWKCLEKWRNMSQDPARCEICRSVYPTVPPLASMLIPSLQDLWGFFVLRLMVLIFWTIVLLSYGKGVHDKGVHGMLPFKKGVMDGLLPDPVCDDPVRWCRRLMQLPFPDYHSVAAKVCLRFPYGAFWAASGEGDAAYSEYGLKYIDAAKHALSRFLMEQALPEFAVLFASPFSFKPLADVAPQLPNPIYGIMTIRKLLHTIPALEGCDSSSGSPSMATMLGSVCRWQPTSQRCQPSLCHHCSCG
ncbi:unnamed protein product [Vitrella brassicaformis CCMP3155]|uniref:RING-CH-type domain-containing protein n=1 Tax=Vitrella brassicaformis (strain CCMP3155) TaxID=1169540 RepID=A0A0G4EEI2_VITBC|nr:unnamed protein product [Vitrella brassicaformis CCMP3155]|eukprot:CEL93784.1 unnamed protein product [Vitrella brassicaformis CCMP3155]